MSVIGKTAGTRKGSSAKRTATTAQQEWNGGLRGVGRQAASLPVGRDCPTEDCGQDAAGTRPPRRGWVRVDGSSVPPRDYCCGSCGTYGIAIAEVRMAATQ
ncbi:hypothetical protein GCM10010329_80650 [Streptomyces spiroverticillatus]|uniref:Uncharacterized protein n=1 Tax=Streptomyces finlayi TaxID=67296 RepID=A0A918X702_9ACTN|nr:hypothetical protein [Streptomyces finlayi]GHA45923.1 hypothetical protein GCM10010329_80650 [Streptomyces spiroverticillatus]GHD15983.1 hypothetical protein GCM10010334_76570 [Streptomyces finlayi]